MCAFTLAVIKLPLQNPILIFSLILFIILFAPILLNKFKIPHLIGLIIAGAIIGPNGFNLILRDSSIILFGTVGLLYIMFLAGLEIDLNEFKKNSGKSFVFGMYTFLIPMGLGTWIGHSFLGFSMMTSILLASMFASHTLIAYPIVSKLGISKNRAVNITVGGTLITDTLALLVLAVIAGLANGDIGQQFWIKLGVSVIVFSLVITFVFPVLSRWFFKRYDDSVLQYIFVLALVFLGAFLAETAGIEGIIGAFMAGLAINRLIPHTSPLMNRIHFVGNALFIPFFLIGVGMLVDYHAFFKDWETIKVAITMTVVATMAKFVAAWFTQKTFRYSRDEMRIIFGLSNAQAAATLAAVLVGYNIVLGYDEMNEPIRLLNESILNGTIVMILVTCTIATLSTQKGAESISKVETDLDHIYKPESDERILIPINNPETIEELVNLGITSKPIKNKSPLYVLKVITSMSSDSSLEKEAKKSLSIATLSAASTENAVRELLRYDNNVVSGVANVVKEHKITDIIMGLHKRKGLSDTFLGHLSEGILAKCNTTTLIYKAYQPLNTITRHVVVVPEHAEKVIGFTLWLSRLWNITSNTGAKLVFYGTENTFAEIKEYQKKRPVHASFVPFTDWNDFLIIARDIKENDNLVIVMSRKDHMSFVGAMNRIPLYLNKYFEKNSFILIYPVQRGVTGSESQTLNDPSMTDPFFIPKEVFDDLGRSIGKIFVKNVKKDWDN